MSDLQEKYKRRQKDIQILNLAIEELCAKLIKDSYGSNFRRAELKKQTIEEATKKIDDPNYKCHIYMTDSNYN